jgi:hypothetical protein
LLSLLSDEEWRVPSPPAGERPASSSPLGERRWWTQDLDGVLGSPACEVLGVGGDGLGLRFAEHEGDSDLAEEAFQAHA